MRLSRANAAHASLAMRGLLDAAAPALGFGGEAAGFMESPLPRAAVELVLGYHPPAAHDCRLCPQQTCLILNLVFHFFNCHWSTYVTLGKSLFPFNLSRLFGLFNSSWPHALGEQ